MGLKTTKKWYERKITANKLKINNTLRDKPKELQTKRTNTFDIIIEVYPEHKLKFRAKVMLEQRINIIAIVKEDDTIQFQN